jgi:hypothetical protein
VTKNLFLLINNRHFSALYQQPLVFGFALFFVNYVTSYLGTLKYTGSGHPIYIPPFQTYFLQPRVAPTPSSTSPGGGGTASSAFVFVKKWRITFCPKPLAPWASNSAGYDSPPSKSPSDTPYSRGRFVSMPHPLPAAIQAHIDIDIDHCAHAIPSLPSHCRLYEVRGHVSRTSHWEL